MKTNENICRIDKWYQFSYWNGLCECCIHLNLLVLLMFFFLLYSKDFVTVLMIHTGLGWTMHDLELTSSKNKQVHLIECFWCCDFWRNSTQNSKIKLRKKNVLFDSRSNFCKMFAQKVCAFPKAVIVKEWQLGVRYKWCDVCECEEKRREKESEENRWRKRRGRETEFKFTHLRQNQMGWIFCV